MKIRAEQIKKLSEDFAALMEQEKQACEKLLSSVLESLRALQADTADRRFHLLGNQMKKLQERIDILPQMADREFLGRIRAEASSLESHLADGRLATILGSLLEAPAPSLNAFCDLLLDRVIAATGAERGFILFYLPESTEADVVAARNFQTTNLSLGEYDFSRSLLREVFQQGAPLLLEDASHDPTFSKEISVVKLQLKAVLASPLRQGLRTVGAIYLENNSIPAAFDREDLKLLEQTTQFAVFYLHHAHLLPALFEPDRSVFFDAKQATKEIVGKDSKILKLLEVVNRIADSPATVLIEGESGTGKELVARALHYESARRDHPFVGINCAAIPDNLLESELFGHEKGAFTGATEQYIGRIEQGDGGTIFLDEVSELAYPLQAKLLRFLQSNEFGRLGGKQTIRVDVRMVAATSKNLKALVDAGKFYDALYYRLNVIPLQVPPLREHKQDIPMLLEHFVSRFSAVYGRTLHVEPDVVEWLMEYPFPGNVRELENLIHRLVALATENFIRVGDLPPEILQTSSQRVSLLKDPLFRLLRTPPSDLEELHRRKQEVQRMLTQQERLLVERVVKEADGNLTEAARRLGMHRITLHRILRKSLKG